MSLYSILSGKFTLYSSIVKSAGFSLSFGIFPSTSCVLITYRFHLLFYLQYYVWYFIFEAYFLYINMSTYKNYLTYKRTWTVYLMIIFELKNDLRALGVHLDFYKSILFFRVLSELLDIFHCFKKFKVVFKIWAIKVGDLNRFLMEGAN